MKEIICMWKYKMMVALTVLCAGVYMLLLLPFKYSFTLIPGYTEIRPAGLLPVLFGLLFGPAGAWGSAIGNLAADLFGTFSAGSIFGFIGNFIYAYIPYKLWGRLHLRLIPDNTPTINSPRKLAEFGIVSILSSISCAMIIAWGNDLLKLVPFTALATIIALNNCMVTLLLGPFLLPPAYSRVKKMGLLWTDIMFPCDRSKPNPDRIYILLTIVGALGGLAFGILLALLFTGEAIFTHGAFVSGTGNLIVGLGILPFLLLFLFGATHI